MKTGWLLLPAFMLIAWGSGVSIGAMVEEGSPSTTSPGWVQPPLTSHLPVRDAEPIRERHHYPANTLVLGSLNAPVLSVAMVGGALTPPPDPREVGWWGRPKGSRHGTTLVVGHTVHTGGGVLDDLEDVPVGTSAHMWGETFRVTRVQIMSKADLARRAPNLFDQSGKRRLVVVTCEDYDPATGEYASNVVVTAVSTNT